MQGCGDWIPATHPDGALYFYDPERVRRSSRNLQPSIAINLAIEEVVY